VYNGGYDLGLKSKFDLRFEIGNRTATEIILHGIAFGLQSRKLRARAASGIFGKVGAPPLPIFATQKFSYPRASVRFDRKLRLSRRKTRTDYGGY
jgi:hypothetical protein